MDQDFYERLRNLADRIPLQSLGGGPDYIHLVDVDVEEYIQYIIREEPSSYEKMLDC